jgi:predicted transglutaminase-like cysteine proteinase
MMMILVMMTTAKPARPQREVESVMVIQVGTRQPIAYQKECLRWANKVSIRLTSSDNHSMLSLVVFLTYCCKSPMSESKNSDPSVKM